MNVFIAVIYENFHDI
jgi:hypothetical protein